MSLYYQIFACTLFGIVFYSPNNVPSNNTSIICPSDISITCGKDYTDLVITGKAAINGISNGQKIVWQDIEHNLNVCGVGSVIRRWSLSKNTNVYCDQRIDIYKPSTFGGNIDWPDDLVIDHCINENNIGKPTWISGSCDKIDYTIVSDTINNLNDICMSISNHYRLIDSCQYFPTDPLWNGKGLYEHTQTIQVLDKIKPKISDCEDRLFEVDFNCNHVLTLTNSASDENSENCPDKLLKWQVFIDLWADGNNDYEFSSFLPANDKIFDDTNGNGIRDQYLAPALSGQSISVTIPEIISNVNISNHKVVWKVTDGCGNSRSCSYNLMVIDKSGPEANCLEKSSYVMENGQVELSAIDFNLNSYDNCSASEDLSFTFEGWASCLRDTAIANRLVNSNVSHFFNAKGFVDFNGDGTVYPLPKVNTLLAYNQGHLQLWHPEMNSSTKIFLCEPYYPEYELQVTVWDKLLNNAFSVVTLTLVDNQGICDGCLPGLYVWGKVFDEYGYSMEDIAVTTISNMPEFPKITFTNVDGEYAFPFLPNNNDYQIYAKNDKDDRSGISTLDIIKIHRHILGLELLETPYKLMAADVNNSGTITGADASQLRKLILRKFENDDLPDSESWRFIVEGTVIDNDDPWPFTEFITLSQIQYDYNIQVQNFIGVKIGDVYKSEEKETNTIYLNSVDRYIDKGEMVKIDFYSKDFEDIFGFQCTINLNGLTYNSLGAGALNIDESNVGVISDDRLTMSWNIAEMITETENTKLFSLSFLADKSGLLSDMISFSSDMVDAEIYTGSMLDIENIDLKFIDDYSFFVSDVNPNPFKGVGAINITVPQSSIVTIEIYDVSGIPIYSFNFNANKGINNIEFDHENFKGSGIYFCRITNGNSSKIKKLLLIEELR